jgi:hypothetical protein
MTEAGVRECEVHPLKDIKDWFRYVVVDQKFMVAPLVFRRHALFRNQDDRSGVPSVAVDFATPESPEAGSAALFPRHENIPDVKQFLSHAGNYVLAQGRGVHATVHFQESHERLVPLGAFILIRASAITHYGIGCLKTWLRGSLRYPDDVEPTEDEHQYHVYIAIRIRTRNGQASVRVIHVEAEDCRVMEESAIAASDIQSEGYVANVQMNGVQP